MHRFFLFFGLFFCNGGYYYCWDMQSACVRFIVRNVIVLLVVLVVFRGWLYASGSQSCKETQKQNDKRRKAHRPCIQMYFIYCEQNILKNNNRIEQYHKSLHYKIKTSLVLLVQFPSITCRGQQKLAPRSRTCREHIFHHHCYAEQASSSQHSSISSVHDRKKQKDKKALGVSVSFLRHIQVMGSAQRGFCTSHWSSISLLGPESQDKQLWQWMGWSQQTPYLQQCTRP